MKHATCPVCKRKFDTESQEARPPLCSERCRLVDLGRWFNEEYRIAAASDDEEDDGVPSEERSPWDE